LILNSFIFCSCKQTAEEEAFKNALEKSNEFIMAHNDRIAQTAWKLAEGDPRQTTQDCLGKIKLIVTETASFINHVQSDSFQVTMNLANIFKKDLIKRIIEPRLQDDYYYKYTNKKTEVKKYAEIVIINDILLLVNDLLSYQSVQNRWSDIKIDIPQTIFKIDSNTYFALIAFDQSLKSELKVELNYIQHGNASLSPSSYLFHYKSGFFGVALNLESLESGKFGIYQINYTVKLNNVNKRNDYEFTTSNYFNIIQ